MAPEKDKPSPHLQLDMPLPKKRRKEPAPEGGGGEGDDVIWLTSYADMMTVLCCFFLLMMSMANFDPPTVGKQLEQIAEYFDPERVQKKKDNIKELQEQIQKTLEKAGMSAGNKETLAQKDAGKKQNQAQGASQDTSSGGAAQQNQDKKMGQNDQLGQAQGQKTGAPNSAAGQNAAMAQKDAGQQQNQAQGATVALAQGGQAQGPQSGAPNTAAGQNSAMAEKDSGKQQNQGQGATAAQSITAQLGQKIKSAMASATTTLMGLRETLSMKPKGQKQNEAQGKTEALAQGGQAQSTQDSKAGQADQGQQQGQAKKGESIGQNVQGKEQGLAKSSMQEGQNDQGKTQGGQQEGPQGGQKIGQAAQPEMKKAGSSEGKGMGGMSSMDKEEKMGQTNQGQQQGLAQQGQKLGQNQQGQDQGLAQKGQDQGQKNQGEAQGGLKSGQAKEGKDQGLAQQGRQKGEELKGSTAQAGQQQGQAKEGDREGEAQKGALGEAKLGSMAHVKIENGQLTITFTGSTIFDVGQTELKDDVKAMITTLTELIKEKNPNYRILVEGHTDSTPFRGVKGPIQSNWALSGVRASKILEEFEKAGFDKRQLIAIGYGDTRPIAPNDSPENIAQNRRVVIKVLEPPSSTMVKLGLGVYFSDKEITGEGSNVAPK